MSRASMVLRPMMVGVVLTIAACQSPGQPNTPQARPEPGQPTRDPFPTAISDNGGLIVVGVVEFAEIPDLAGEPARLQHVADVPGTDRIFTNDMAGPLYSISYEGQAVTVYLDVSDPRWGVGLEIGNFELGVQSFAFHPQFTQTGSPGFGKLYTWLDTNLTAPAPDFEPGGGEDTQDTVLLEWTASGPEATTYDGGPPRELFRVEQPWDNHNGGQMGFDPTASPADPDFGLLYIGIGDGGDANDPLNNAQDLSRGFGKIFRIDPLGSNSENGAYGIPSENPFAGDSDAATLDEIYAYGIRNPQSFAWDPENGNLFLADIGQETAEELNLIDSGANLGWNVWEGSFRFVSGEGVTLANRRGDTAISYPIAEYDQQDPILHPSSAASGVYVYRGDGIPGLEDLILFGDNPSGEIFYVSADEIPNGGQDSVRRILLRDDGEAKTLFDLVREKNGEQGRPPATRMDFRMGFGPDGHVLLLNKQDGIIRMLVPDGES